MIHIITDTTSGLSREFANFYHIPVIPQIINFGNQSFFEDKDINNAQFMKMLSTAKELPKTAAPPPELFIQEFSKLCTGDNTIFCLHPSGEVSGTVRSASMAAQEFPKADIRVIDTRTVGSPLSTLVQLAAEWVAKGEQADRIEQKIKQLIPSNRVYFVVDTLEYLAKGGRIGGATALLGSVLKIKPILVLNNGRVEPFEKERIKNTPLTV
jgi:DegV family protein with EDD domain